MDKHLRTNITFHVIEFSLHNYGYGSVLMVEKSKIVAGFYGKQTNVILVAQHNLLILSIKVHSKVSYGISFYHSSIDSPLIFTDYVWGKSKTGSLDFYWYVFKLQFYILHVSCIT